ncbi:unnamed protein product [Ambrosiozyma monospora]|uniref:Unnamed protein product n=1 Tax=Ambrosiozyma monospora TaxID=43982 RepID=A0ACB5T156_AMBMO|nr:unnamed protein product [Ambrosiozyma monospora]
MSEYQNNEPAAPTMSKKDKRRQQIQTKLTKMEHQFQNDKDYYYRESLVQLQYKLSSLHSGDNPNYVIKIRDFEELRDAELLRLRLDEEYQVNFINKEFKKDYEDAIEENEKIIEMVKTKLRDRILKKIKQLKEDKALIDIATSSTSSNHSSSRYHIQRGNRHSDNSLTINNNDSNGYNSGFESSSSFFFPGERRSRRSNNKRYDAYERDKELETDIILEMPVVMIILQLVKIHQRPES